MPGHWPISADLREEEPEVDRVETAARVIYDAGRHHGWSGFSKPFDDLDPIGRKEFMAIIHSALKAADAVDDVSSHR